MAQDAATRAACYIRVSTEEQTEYSPDAQQRALVRYAQQHHMTVAPEHIYLDAGLSGRRAETRPAFMAMIAAAKSRPAPFDCILVHRFDRFARRTASFTNPCSAASAAFRSSASQSIWKTTR